MHRLKDAWPFSLALIAAFFTLSVAAAPSEHQVPQNVVASTDDTNAVTVVWDAVPDATGYEVTVESWGVATSHAERTVTVDEACLVDRELPLPGLGRYTVRAVYPNGVKGAASAPAVGWRALDKAEVTGLATRRPWNGTVDIDLACQTVRDKYAQTVDGASALPEKTVTVAATTADGAAFAVQSLVRERLDASAGIIRREPVTNGSFTLGANDRIVWDARSDAPRMREPGAVLKVTLAGDAYGGPIVIERTFDLDTRTGLIDLPFGAENIRIPWSTRWAKPEVKEGGLGFGENDAWWKQTAVLTDVTDSANHVEILRTEAKLGEGTVCTWTPKNWGVNTLTLTLSPVSGSNERTEYAAVFRMPDFAFVVRAANEDGVTLRWRALDGAASYEIRRRSAGASGDFETVTNVTDVTTWTDSSVDTIVGTFEYVVVPKTAGGGGSLPVLSPVTGTRGAPQTPQNVVASTNDTNAVTVVWDAVPKASGYEVKVENWDVAINRTERTVTVDEACLVDRELPLPGLGRYTVRAVYPNGVKGAASAPAVGWRALDKAEVTGLATRRPWNGTVDIDLACQTVRDKYAQTVDGASALPEKTVTVAATTADGAAFAVQSLVRERLDASAGIIRREPVTNGSFTLGANDRIVWDARSDAPRMREPGAVLKVTLAGDAYGGPIVIERTFDLDTRTGLIDLPFGAENIRIPWSTRWAKPEVKEGGLGFGENDAWWKQTAVLTDVTDSANHVEILRTEAKLGEGTVCTWTPKNWGVNTLTLTLSPVSGSNERTEYAAVFRMPDFAFVVRAANEDGVTLRWRALDGAASYEIRRRSAGASGDFETVTNVTDVTTWTDSSVDTIVGTFEYVVVPKTAGGGGSLPVLSPVTGTRGAPQTPQNVVASTNDTNAVTVVWDAVPKASGYEVKVENWDVAINRTERTVTVDEACFVDTELPQPGLGRYTVTAVYPNGVKGEPSAPAVGHAALDTMKILGASTRWPWNGTVDLDVEYKTVRPRFRELFGMDNLPYPTNVTLAATTADGASIAVQTLVKESPLDTGTYTVNRAEVPNGAQDPGGTMIFRGSGRTRLVWDAEADAPDRAAPGATLTLTVSDDRCRTTDSCRIDLDTTKPRAIPLAEEVAEISLPWAARWADETSASLNMQDGSDVKVVAITRYNAVTNVVNTLTMLADEGGMLTNRIDDGVTVLECTISNRATGAQTTYTRQFIRAPVIPATAVRRPGQNAIDVMWTVVDGCTYYQVVRRTVYRDGTRGAWGNRMGVSPSGTEGSYPDIGVDALTLYEFAVCPKYPDPSDYGYVTAEPVLPSAPVSVLGARLDLYNLSVGDPWDCTVGVDFAYASCRLLSDPTDLAHISLKDLTGGTNVSARTLALDGASVSNGAFTLDLDPAQGAVSTGRLAWHATADLPNAYLTNVVLEIKMQPSGTTAVTAPFTLDTRGTRATFDALGPYLAGGATAVTETVAAAYGTLQAATRAGYRLAGWFLGVTNGAPQAREGGAPLRLGPHTLYARWAVDPTVSPDVDAEGNSIYVWEVRPDGQTARICGFRDPNLRVADLVLPDAIGGHPVTEIADCAFANSASGLTALTLPVYCTTVGRRAFSGIKTLTGLAFTPVRDWASPSDAGELAIGAYAFAATGLTAAFLPVEVAQIGDYAFADCRKLTEATVLGRPAVGLRPFRRAGIDAGTKPTIYLHRDLANDADYLGQITQGFGNDVFAVRTDAVVRGLSLGALAVPAPGTVRLSVDVERASTWGEVDASRLRVEYRARLGDAPTDLVPRAVASEPDGSLTVEVDAPEGPSGFFRVKLVE